MRNTLARIIQLACTYRKPDYCCLPYPESAYHHPESESDIQPSLHSLMTGTPETMAVGILSR